MGPRTAPVVPTTARFFFLPATTAGQSVHIGYEKDCVISQN